MSAVAIQRPHVHEGTLGLALLSLCFRAAGIAAVATAIGLGTTGASGPAFAATANLSPGLSAKFRPIAQLPRSSTDSAASVANIVNITKHPSLSESSYNGWLTVADSRGPVYLVNVSSYKPGVANPTRTIVNLKTATQGLDIGNATAGNSELGLRWIEYHPDFAKPNTKGYLKFYTMSCHATSTRSLAGAVALNHKAPSGAPTVCYNVLREWTMDPATMTGKTPREVLRFPQLYTNHGTDALVFDPATKLLYIAVGDGGSQGDPYNVSQNKQYLYGKILRIDPTKPGTTLPSNMGRATEGTFSYPMDNPYAAPGDSGRNAIYAIGFRHPETMIWDDEHLIVFDIGGSNLEEIDILEPDGDEGKNFGWDKVEQRSPQFTTTIPPVAGYTHVSGNKAIIGGAAPESGPYAGLVILGDIVSGNVYYGDRDAMKAARSWTIPMVPLHQFVMHNNGGTPQTLMQAFGRNSRVDLRLVEDNGRVFGVTKQRGIIFEILPR
jgi:glucose/arabinose dehydrogenase